CIYTSLFTDTAPPGYSPLSLHDALPISPDTMIFAEVSSGRSCLAISAPTKLDRPASPPAETASIAPEPPEVAAFSKAVPRTVRRSEEHTSELQSRENLVCRLLLEKKKST